VDRLKVVRTDETRRVMNYLRHLQYSLEGEDAAVRRRCSSPQ